MCPKSGHREVRLHRRSSVTFLLRVHALYRSRRVLGFLIAIAVGTVIVAIWAIASRRNETSGNDMLLGISISELPGCNFLFTSNEYVFSRLAYINGTLSSPCTVVSVSLEMVIPRYSLTWCIQGFGASWTGVLVFDLTVFLLTARMGIKEFRHTSSKLWHTIFYNGALYFLYV